MGLIIEERAADIGKFMVGRLLPFRQKRMVGPFIYIDEVEIKLGAVNWMTAGKGIVHSERTPEYLRHSEKNMHGLKIWVALPKELEQMEPEFFHIDKEKIPRWNEGDLQFKLVAGEAFGRKSDVPVYSKLFMLEIKSKTRQTVNIGHELYGEAGLYILEGSIESEGNIYGAKQLLVAKESSLCEFTIEANSDIYIFGDEPSPEERFIDWNFVSSDKLLIEKAKQNWQAQMFDKIPGDETEFVPYPSQLKK